MPPPARSLSILCTAEGATAVRLTISPSCGNENSLQIARKKCASASSIRTVAFTMIKFRRNRSNNIFPVCMVCYCADDFANSSMR